MQAFATEMQHVPPLVKSVSTLKKSVQTKSIIIALDYTGSGH